MIKNTIHTNENHAILQTTLAKCYVKF